MRVKNYLLTAAVAVSMTASPVLGPLTAWAGSAPLTSEAIRTGAPAQHFGNVPANYSIDTTD